MFLIIYNISFSPINNAMENELPQSQKNTLYDEKFFSMFKYYLLNVKIQFTPLEK